MSRIEDLQQEILNLAKADYIKLKNWLNESDWEEWDQQIEEDSANGKLDSLLSEDGRARRLALDGNTGLERGRQQ